MKRIALLAMCCLVLCACAVTTFAEDGGIYENAEQLYEAWYSQGIVPDYISGVWVTDGSRANLTVGVVKGEAGEAGRQEILDLVKDDSTVTIVYQTYSRNYLWQIQEAIEDAYFLKGLGLVTVGVSEYENKLCFEVHTDFADNSDTQEMIRQVTEQYGDAVCFRFIDAYPQLVGGTQPPALTRPVPDLIGPQKQDFPFVLVVTFCVMMLSCFCLAQIRRRRILLLTSNGVSVVTDEQLVSERETENIIREAKMKPSESLDDRVMRSIGLNANKMDDSKWSGVRESI